MTTTPADDDPMVDGLARACTALRAYAINGDPRLASDVLGTDDHMWTRHGILTLFRQSIYDLAEATERPVLAVVDDLELAAYGYTEAVLAEDDTL